MAVTIGSQTNKIRFLGICVGRGTNAIVNVSGYSFYDSNDRPIVGSSSLYKRNESITEDYIPLEYILDVPQNAVTFRCSTFSSNRDGFYCYLQRGESVFSKFQELDILQDEIYGYEGEMFVDEISEWTSCGNSRGMTATNWNVIDGGQGKFVGIEPNTRIKLENFSKNGGFYAILKDVTGYATNGTSVHFATGESRKIISKESSIILDIPTDGNYLYLSTMASSYNTDIKAYISGQCHFEGLKDRVEKLEEGEGSGISSRITHLSPDNVGQENVVRRMRKFSDIEYSPAFDFSRLSSGGGASSYRDVFLAGHNYKGIPYSRSYYKMDEYGYKRTPSDYTGFKIGFYISIETFITAIANRGTVMELESVFSHVDHNSAFYSNICAGSVSAALGVGYMDTEKFWSVPIGFSDKGIVNSDFDLNVLRLGDVMAKTGVHTAMVTDVIYNDGKVTYVEITESTTQGNANYNIIGGQLGGVARRLWWTAEQFLSTWNGYKVIRYNNIKNVPYIPSPYVPMPDEQYGYAPYTMAVLPYMGNRFRYVAGANQLDRILKLVVTVKSRVYGNVTIDDKTSLAIEKYNESNDTWEEIGVESIDYSGWDDESHPYTYVMLSDERYKAVGQYRAFAFVYRELVNGEYVYSSSDSQSSGKTSTCQWSVVDSVNLLNDY